MKKIKILKKTTKARKNKKQILTNICKKRNNFPIINLANSKIKEPKILSPE